MKSKGVNLYSLLGGGQDDADEEEDQDARHEIWVWPRTSSLSDMSIPSFVVHTIDSGSCLAMYLVEDTRTRSTRDEDEVRDT
jgi:hypothetical protein